MKNKKILVLTQSFPPNPGGEAEYIYNFTKHLCGDATIMAYSYGKRNKYNEANSERAKRFKIKRVHLFPPFFSLVTRISSLITMFSLQSKHQFDVVICNHVKMGYLSLLMKSFFGVDYFLILHGWELTSGQKNIKRYKKIIEGAKKIIANSEFTKNNTLKQYPDIKYIEVIPPMINERFIREEGKDLNLKKEMGLQGKRILLTVGRLSLNDNRKGHDLVLMSLPKIIKKYPEVVYLIVGDGEARNGLVNLSQKLGISDKVIFCDYNKDSLKQYYKNCDIFIMPNRIVKETSSVEGFGIVFLEAAFVGKPCIGGRTGGVADVIIENRTGLLVNPTDISDISSAVCKLLDNPKYAAKLGQEAKNRAWNYFSPDKIREKVMRLGI